MSSTMSSPMSSTMSSPHFLLLDIETTGLNPETCGILEVSALLMHSGMHSEKLLEIEKFHAYVNPENTTWDTEALQMHRKTGLIDRLSEGKLYDDVEKSILYLLRNCGTVILMGNSIHFDRSFIARYMPILNSRLHYRLKDVYTAVYGEGSDGLG